MADLFPEDKGYAAAPGFVKSNPLNNDYYVEAMKNDPWYPAISKAHQELTKKFPGYNITQIKEKFGELRFYFSQGACPDSLWDYDEAAKIIRKAEEETRNL